MKQFRVLFENSPALNFCNYKKKNTHMLDTLFIGYFKDIMEQYIHY